MRTPWRQVWGSMCTYTSHHLLPMAAMGAVDTLSLALGWLLSPERGKTSELHPLHLQLGPCWEAACTH